MLFYVIITLLIIKSENFDCNFFRKSLQNQTFLAREILEGQNIKVFLFFVIFF